MALGVLYTATLNSLHAGTTVLVEVLKESPGGSTSKIIANDGCVISPQGPDASHVYHPLLSTSAEARLWDPNGTIATELSTASDRSHLLRITVGGVVQFLGYVLPDPVETHLASFPGSIVLQATDGLPGLDDIPFIKDNGDVYNEALRPLDAILRCLERIGLSLNLKIRSNLFTDFMNTTDDATRQVTLPAHTWTDEDGAPYSCGDVLRAMLTAHHVVLRQSGGYWRATDYDLLFSGNTHKVFEYDFTATRISSANENFRVQVTQAAFDDDVDLAGSSRSYIPAVWGVSVVHPHGHYPSAIRNGAFGGVFDRRNKLGNRLRRPSRDSIVPGAFNEYLLTDTYWTNQAGGAITVATAEGPNGENVAVLDAVGADLSGGSPYDKNNPLAKVTEFIQQTGLEVVGGSGRRLYTTQSVYAKSEPGEEAKAVTPCHFYIKLVGTGATAGTDYYLALDGTFKTAQQVLNFQHLKDGFRGVYADRWESISIASTQDIPSGTYQVFVRYYQPVDIARGSSNKIEKAYWTNLFVDLFENSKIPEETVYGASESNGSSLTQTVQVMSGDLPILGMRGSFYDAVTGTPGSNWKIGSTGSGSGRAHGEVLAELIFRGQAENVEVLNVSSVHPSLSTPLPHQVWEVAGVRYFMGESQINPITGVFSGQFVRIKQAGNPAFGVFKAAGGSYAGIGGGGAAAYGELDGVLNQLFQLAVAQTTSAIAATPTLTTLPIDSLKTTLETGDGIIVITPYGDYYEMTVGANASEGATSITVVSFNLTDMLPANTGVYLRDGEVKTLLILTRDAFRVSLRSGAVGTVSSAISGNNTSIPVAGTLTAYQLKDNDKLSVLSAETGGVTEVTVDGSAYGDGIVPAGLAAIPIYIQNITAAVGDAVRMSEKQWQSDILQHATDLTLRVLSSEVIATWKEQATRFLTSLTAPANSTSALTVQALPEDVPDGTKLVLEYERTKDPVDGTSFFDTVDATVNGSHSAGATTLNINETVTVPVDTMVIVTQEAIFTRFKNAEGRITVTESSVSAEVSRYESQKIAEINATYAGSTSTLSIKNLTVDLKKGDTFIVTRMSDGTRTQVVIDQDRSAIAGPTTISIVTNTVYANVDDPILPGSITSLRVELGAITVQAERFATNAWNGTINDAGQITAYSGAAGWALGSAGHFEFTDGTNYVRWSGGTFEIRGSVVITAGSGIGNLSDAGALATVDHLGDVPDGGGYAKVLSTQLSAGKVQLAQVEGTLDNVGDGATYGKVLLTSLSAGKIVLSQAEGTLDNILDGSTYGRVRQTILGAGYIQVGSGTKDTDLNGWHIDETEIVGQASGADQVVLNTSGQLVAGAGVVTVGSSGIRIDSSASALTPNVYSIRRTSDGSDQGGLWGNQTNGLLVTAKLGVLALQSLVDDVTISAAAGKSVVVSSPIALSTGFDITNGPTDVYWHAGNDGVGSGLDADLLDGKQLAAIVLDDLTETTYPTLFADGDVLRRDDVGGTERWKAAAPARRVTFIAPGASDVDLTVPETLSEIDSRFRQRVDFRGAKQVRLTARIETAHGSSLAGMMAMFLFDETTSYWDTFRALGSDNTNEANTAAAKLRIDLDNVGTICTEWQDLAAWNAEWTLASGISNVATTVQMNEATTTAPKVPFLMRMNDEVVKVTANTTGTKTLTIVRNFDGRGAAAHSANDGAHVNLDAIVSLFGEEPDGLGGTVGLGGVTLEFR